MATIPEFQTLGLDNFQSSYHADIYLLDHVTQGNNHITTAHKHDFYLFFLIEQSNGTHNIDFIDYPVRNYQLHILLPGQVHHWQLADDTKGFQLMFTQNLFDSFPNAINLSASYPFKSPSVIDLNQETFQLLNYEYNQLDHELKKEERLWDMILLRWRIISALIAHETARSHTDKNLSKPHPIVSQYLKLIDEYYKQSKKVSFYAKKLNITANYLNILCRKNANHSANTLIQNRVILESKRLLQISKLSIKEIAYDLGFEDLAYFSNFFKTHTGISPRDFREKL
ncbi:AraC family transcriptional regulator [Pedobacter rhizosphaerae]|uniref:AraC-type DNA-binding protein n=1 Tax=Pedobacter rhizosphaerae TaxID=390241 RepID=A0A1H9QZF5_9SPHI|nr:helix-turn-helix domain-containing protein [Pedobacter rhizosphaerae]SER65209.1 AraC-type DNA-binding protein [Pedobacter rhizosphaerae]